MNTLACSVSRLELTFGVLELWHVRFVSGLGLRASDLPIFGTASRLRNTMSNLERRVNPPSACRARGAGIPRGTTFAAAHRASSEGFVLPGSGQGPPGGRPTRAVPEADPPSESELQSPADPRSLVARLRTQAPELRDLFRLIGREADDTELVAYAVGGFVRDLLLGVTTKDLDVVVEGDSLTFARRLADRCGGVCVEYPRFGTATVVFPGGRRVDVATARSERYARPGALPDVTAGGIVSDLHRRDFTVNSMALILNRQGFGQLLDPFGGLADLRHGRIRVLHERSFHDDPTRVIRAVRFEQRLGFRIEDETSRLLRDATKPSLFRTVSAQRIRNELVLIARGPSAAETMRRLDALGILAALHPGLALDSRRKSILARLEERLQWYHGLAPGEPLEDWALRLQVLLVSLKADQRRVVIRRLSLQNRVAVIANQLAARARRILSRLSDAPRLRPSQVYFLLAPLRPEAVLFLTAMTTSKRAIARLSLHLTTLRCTRLKINGRDLIALGLSPGPAHGRILQRVLAAALDGTATDRRQQLALAAHAVGRCRRP
jgi:tRNA nucleotidyltransferase (CCA-adding enzyme)